MCILNSGSSKPKTWKQMEASGRFMLYEGILDVKKGFLEILERWLSNEIVFEKNFDYTSA